jgi:predicted small lipoprotein YifL
MMKNTGLVAALTFALLASACGKKGPLEAPQKPQAAPKTASAAPILPQPKN